MTILRWATGLCLLAIFALVLAPALLFAQTTASSVQAPAGYAPMSAPCIKQTDGTCRPVSSADALPIAAKQESFALATANVAAAVTTVYGGDYALSQSCTSYNNGSLTLRSRGPDGVSMIGLVMRAAADSGGATLMSLGSSAVVDVTLPAGSTGCNATLSRVP